LEKEQRNALRKAVETARRLLEQEVSDQLEGLFNILPSGEVLTGGPGDPIVRAKLIEVIEHHRTGGAKPAEAAERLKREAAFTILNRFAALKMAEKRGLARECISRGLESAGIHELADVTPGLSAAFPDKGYRLLLECLMDELSLGLQGLFDRRGPTGLIWPRPVALERLLEILNDGELAAIWAQDETIGWIYQYFNSQDERREMREAGAPRNSRELAVRNQFFTPRYVVEFLTDNTLGRTWYEMRQGRTRLRAQCRYLVHRPNEVFLVAGDDATDGDLYIRFRPKKDPRELKTLDPGCGSGHFLLYAFDLLATIYEEAWLDSELGPVLWEEAGFRPGSDTALGDALSQAAGEPAMRRLRTALPRWILERNLYGIDIDPRAVQIAALALWMRAQCFYNQIGLSPEERPVIGKMNLVTAEPMPGEKAMLADVVSDLQPALLGQVVEKVFEQMRLAGETGSLLEIEQEIQSALDRTRRAWQAGPPEQLGLLPEIAQPRQNQLDLTNVGDAAFWSDAEARIYKALERYAQAAGNGKAFARRLFARDTAEGFAFIDLCRQRYDVVLMNPPFGEPSKRSKSYVVKAFPRTKNDLYAAFVERGIHWLHPGGLLGAITSRTGFFLTSFRKWREDVVLGEARPTVVADLGYGVLDTAMVEVAAYCLEKSWPTSRTKDIAGET
jgi:hypothetical protein